MITSYPLRLYANPVKQFNLLLGSVTFVLIGLLMVHDPKMRVNPFKTVMAYGAIVFFGLCTVVFLIMILRYIAFRHPVIQIDEQGWSYNPPLGGNAQAVPWQNISAINLYRQQVQRTTTYHLVVYAKDRPPAPHSLHREVFSARFYPSLSGVVLIVPLNTLFVRATPAKCQRLLERIASACAFEIQFYGVHISEEIYDM